ncbi:hypothetical protein NLU13_8235 [Sarocladium strictum]|uniref:Uncharacterized protein n=1 Tax=Sarocladium strictum TaxID=5046 RepID=A0AA39GBR8_SARSR|nr:hypothetical protein NLU13_8235 [Sarocladium strictum]
MSIQKATASAVAVTQENTIALANLNFDFSLFKVEAPASFKGLGNELTSTRKKAAEEGTLHITARKLGALFQSLSPSCPALVQAYGERVTQIASRRDLNPKATRMTHGLFKEHAGIDGTSIWAAATSGPESIAAHLLACLLARIWTPPEAVSIWVELVEHRRKDLQSVDDTDALYVRALEASKISVSREQLAEWDASARAWLRTADQAMGTKHTQLLLILNNVNIPVNQKPSVYESVIDAWTSGMSAGNKLVKGMPQSTQDGSVLLGLAAWHIYPDMLVLGKTPTEVKQNDDVVTPGALLTIGLQMKAQSHAGVYWSLSLSHLRYYGRPTVTERSLEEQANRLTVDQLLLVALSSLTRTWEFNLQQLAPVFRALWDQTSKVAAKFCEPQTTHWLGLFAQACELLLDADDFKRKTAAQLVRFGAKRAPAFVHSEVPSQMVPPLFGLLKFKTYFSVLSQSGKIDALRKLADTLNKTYKVNFLIRYQHEKTSLWQYATAVPIERPCGKRDAQGNLKTYTTHVRWLHESYYPNESARHSQILGEEVIDLSNDDVSITEKIYTYNTNDDFDDFTADEASESETITWKEATSALVLLSQGYDHLVADNFASESFSYVAGDHTTSLHWSLDASELTWKQHVPRIVGLDDILWTCDRQHFEPDAVMGLLAGFFNTLGLDEMRTSFRALATITKIYKLLPDATISIGITSTPLYRMLWTNQSKKLGLIFSCFAANWASTFSCIITLESGSLHIEPAACNNVMAVSVEDSIYIASPLLCDPLQDPNHYEVSRIRGNVGRSGIAMLIPPAGLERPEFDLSCWNLINHEAYDGRDEDSFQSTSLHLSFTGYTLPADIGKQGFRDTELYYMEARITVHNHGQEVADVDILGCIQSGELIRIPPCPHPPGLVQDSKAELMDHRVLTMIDNWHELLDNPSTPAVARSSGNWLGRLALVVVGHQLGHKMMISPDVLCWACVREFWAKRDVRHAVQVVDRLKVDPTLPSFEVSEKPSADDGELWHDHPELKLLALKEESREDDEGNTVALDVSRILADMSKRNVRIVC